MAFDLSQLPEPILRFNTTEKELTENGIEIKGSNETQWNSNSIELVKSILPLISIKDGKCKVNYNFTHLSHILNIPKKDIYLKLIELYHIQEENDLQRLTITSQYSTDNTNMNQFTTLSLSPREMVPKANNEANPDYLSLELLKLNDHSAFKSKNQLQDNHGYSLEVSSNDDDSGVNINLASQFLHRNKFGGNGHLTPRNINYDDEEDNTSLESLLLEEEVLRQI